MTNKPTSPTTSKIKNSIPNRALAQTIGKQPSIFKTIKEYIIMTIGMCLYSFGWIGCVLPAKSTSGAASGLAIVISTALENSFGWDIKIGTIVLCINVVLLIAAGFILGWNFGIKTIYCIFVLSMSMNVWQEILPADDFLHLDRFLSMVVGGVITGFGVAMALMQGGSAGGTDILAMIINKFRAISYGRIIFILDLLIIASSLTVGFSIDAAIYGYIMTLVFGYTVDMILAGNKQSSQVFIISPKYEEITTALNYELGRGVTLLDSEGGYTHRRSKMVMVVCSNRETPTVLNFVKRIDPDAFITVGSVMGVYGRGFQPIKL
ncbi:MAG: YitT family protein [Alistipes sp.]|nr:YitT family protein [Rikenellaceae bacterium]MBQ3148003.1 YitT family protein [Alistipes sp.]MBQ4127050.1 YitT family protein [Alistipes sp.]